MPPPAKPSASVDVVFAIQVRLDREHFSTGGIDGRWGSKSEKALAAWQKKNGKPATGQVDDAVVAALGDTNGVMTTYAVAADDHAALTPYPSSWLERSLQERMGFATIEEMLETKMPEMYYVPDNFTLTIQSHERMFGALVSAVTAPVEFRRANDGIS